MNGHWRQFTALVFKPILFGLAVVYWSYAVGQSPKSSDSSASNVSKTSRVSMMDRDGEPPAVYQPQSSQLRSKAPKTTSSETTSRIRQNDKYNFDYKMKMGGTSISESALLEDKSAALLRADGKLGVNFASWFDVRIQAMAQFLSQRSQSRLESDMDNGLWIREAVMRLKPFTGLTLAAGAINQEHVGSPLLVRRSLAFPGALEELQFPLSAENKIWLRLQQTIPTSQSFDDERAEKEPTPTFFTEAIGLDVTLWNRLNIKPFASHFRFTDLPAKVAFASLTGGNTLSEEALPSTARYKYGFEGYLLGTDASWRLTTDWTLFTELRALENSQAPSDSSSGRWARTGIQWQFVSQRFIGIAYTQFYNESDASPAYYNDGVWVAHNNREGQMGEAFLLFKDLGFGFKARYSRAEAINPSPYQGIYDLVELWMETYYDGDPNF